MTTPFDALTRPPARRSATYLSVTSSVRTGAPIDPKYFGVFGDGINSDQRGVTDIVDAACDSARIVLEGAPTMLLGETVVISERKGIVITTERRPFPDGLNVPRFTWEGSSDAAMFLIDRCQEIVLDGFAFETDAKDAARKPAAIALDVDNGPDTRGSGNGSSCTFSRLRHITHKPNPNGIFIAIARTTHWNQEYHDIVDCAGNGNGAGTFLFQGQSANTKQTRVRLNRAIVGYDKALWIRNGSFHLDTNNLSGNVWNLYCESASEICTEHATSSEQSRHHAFYGGAIESWGNKFDPSHTAPGEAYIVFGRSCRRVNVRGSLDNGLPHGARALGFENDASNRFVDVTLDTDNGMTRRQLGIDRERLEGAGDAGQQAGAFRFRTRPGSVTDLPSGLLEFNVPSATIEYMRNEWTKSPSVRPILSQPVDWTQLTPGTSVDYLDLVHGLVRRQICLPDGSRAVMSLGTFTKTHE